MNLSLADLLFFLAFEPEVAPGLWLHVCAFLPVEVEYSVNDKSSDPNSHDELESGLDSPFVENSESRRSDIRRH